MAPQMTVDAINCLNGQQLLHLNLFKAQFSYDPLLSAEFDQTRRFKNSLSRPDCQHASLSSHGSSKQEVNRR